MWRCSDHANPPLIVPSGVAGPRHPGADPEGTTRKARFHVAPKVGLRPPDAGSVMACGWGASPARSHQNVIAIFDGAEGGP